MAWLKWLLAKAWLLVAILTILAALATVTARQLLPLLPQYRAEIEQVAGEALGRTIRIGSIEVGWHWLSPQVRLENVRVLQSAQGRVLLKLSTVSVGFDVLRSLIERRPVADTVLLRGVHLKLTRERDGRVSMSGLPLAVPSSKGAPGNLSSSWLTGVRLELENASVLLSDTRSGADYRLRDLTFSLWVSRDGDIRMAGGARLPARLGRRLSFAAELHGLLTQGQPWGGRIFLDLSGAHLDTPLLREFAKKLPAMSGRLSARLWTTWSSGRLQDVSGHFEAMRLALGGDVASDTSGRVSPALTRLAANFAWSRKAGGWELQANQVVAGDGERTWPESAFSLAEVNKTDGSRFYGWASFMRLEDLTPLLMAQPTLPSELRERLLALAPSGDVSDLQFDVSLPNEGAPRASVSARFTQLSLRADGRVPGVSGATGTLRATPDGGTLVLDSSALAIDAPRVFSKIPPAAAVRGRVEWSSEPGGLAFHSNAINVANADFSVKGQFGLWVPKTGHPYLNMLLHMNRGKVAATHLYLPSRLFNADLNHWLDKGLLEGEVTEGNLVLRGDPLHFPFRGHEGVFEARLKVTGGALAYFKNWPRLSGLKGEVAFDGASLHVDAEGGRLLSTQIESASLDIPDMEHARLHIKASGEGPLADVPIYLSYTPLGDGRQALFDEMRAKGHERLSLDITLPLMPGQLKNWRLTGVSRVSDGFFALPAHDFALDAINGRIEFTQRSLRARDVTARFRGQPVKLGATTRADGLATLTLDGHYSVAELLGKDSPVTRFARGDADVRLSYILPMTPEGFRRYGTGIVLASDLRNVAVNLPAPLGKKAGEERGFVLRFSVERPHAPIWLRYGEAFQAVLRLAGRGNCLYPAAVDLRYDTGAPKLPAQGITLEAKVPRLDVDAWRHLQVNTANRPGSSECPNPISDALSRVRSLNVQAQQLHLFGRDFSDASVNAQREGQEWLTKVTSNVLSGTIRIPLALHGGSPVRFDLSRLAISPNQASSPSGGSATLNPADLPPLSGRIARVEFDGRTVENVHLTTTPIRDGLQIHQLQIETPQLHTRISGDWRKLNGDTQTHLQIELKTEDAGKALEGLRLSSALAGGKGQASASLSWAGAPYNVSWKTLTGQVSLSLRDGSLKEINPGQTGRLLGLFNLSQLPKRLTLGFGDLFQKGFVFDTLKGDFQFRGGNLYTQNLSIVGASATIGIKGRFGMLAQDLDVNVTVLPQVDSALPLAGAAIGGPAAGAAVYLLDRLLGLGRQLNKAAEIKYHVSGSWDSPQIKVENAPRQMPNPANRHGLSSLY